MFVEPSVIQVTHLALDEIAVGANVTVNVGARIVLRCEASGYPIPSLSWTIDGVSINSMSHIEIKENGTLLIVSNVLASDSNRYTCSAKNRVSETERSSVVTVRTCVSAFRQFLQPKCVVTILLLEKSETVLASLRSDQAQLLLQQLEDIMTRQGIGVDVKNLYGVVTFGDRAEPRILQAGFPLSDLFGVQAVPSALQQLTHRSTLTQSDGYQALLHALEEIEMGASIKSQCASNLLLATAHHRTANIMINFPTLRRRLCKHQPFMITSLLNVEFITRNSSQVIMGIDWNGNFYGVSSQFDDTLLLRRNIQFLPVQYSTCLSLNHYGRLSLYFHGSVWDISRLNTTVEQKALVYATVSSLQRLTSCEECTCSKDGLPRCVHVKNSSYCQCRREGDTVCCFTLLN